MSYEREKLLFIYSNALERGDIATLGEMLAHAEDDPTLGEMLAELDALYLSETRQEEYPMITTREKTTFPQWLTWAVASVAAVLFCALAVTMAANPTSTPSLAAIDPDNLQPLTTENADQLTLLDRIGVGYAFYTEWSPDGETLAVASATGVYLHDDLDEGRRLGAYDREVFALDYSSDGATIAATTANDGLYLLDATTGELLASVAGDIFGKANFALDDTALVVRFCDERGRHDVCIAQALTLYDIASGDTQILEIGPEEATYSVWAISPDGETLAVAINDSTERTTTYFQDLRRLDLPARVEAEPDASAFDPTVMEFSPDGELLLAADTGNNRRVKIWDVGTATQINGYSASEFDTFPMIVTFADNDRILLVDGNGRIISRPARLVSDAPIVGQIPEQLRFLTDIGTYDRAAKRLIAPTIKGDLTTWDLSDIREPQLIGTIEQYDDLNQLFHFGPGENQITQYRSGSVTVLDYLTGERLIDNTRIIAFRHQPLSIGEGNQIAYPDYLTGEASPTAQIISWPGEETRTLDDYRQIVALQYAPDGDLLAYAYRKRVNRGDILRLDSETGEISMIEPDSPFPIYSNPPISGQFSDDGDLLIVTGTTEDDDDTPDTAVGAYYCDPCALVVYDTATGEMLLEMPLPYSRPQNEDNQTIDTVTITETGQQLLAVSGCSDEEVFGFQCDEYSVGVWAINADEAEMLFEIRDRQATAVAFNADGTLLTVREYNSDRGADTYLYDAQTGDLLTTITDGEWVFSQGIAFNTDNTLLAIGRFGVVHLYGVPDAA